MASNSSEIQVMQPNVLGDHEARQEEETNPEATGGDECLEGMELAVYTAAKEGNIDGLSEHKERLHQILTPTRNTVLHIYIACAMSTNPEEESDSVIRVQKILEMCPPLLFLTNENGDTALHAAAKNGRTAIVKILVQAAEEENEKVQGAWPWLIRKTNEEGDTSLHVAVRFNHLDVVKILIIEDHEFSQSANHDGETPLYMAAERRFRDVFFQILDTHQNPAYGGPNGRTCLHAAIIRNDEGKLLEWKRELTKVVDDQGCTPLHLAASMGHTLIVKQLLKYDRSAAYIKEKEHKWTALHFAAYYGHVRVMRSIIRECPDCCELVDDKRRNIIHTALTNDKANLGRLWRMVLKDPWLSNVLLNGKDDNGDTPLHRFASQKSPGLYFLIDRFATDARIDKMAFNKENQNALNMLQQDDRNIVKSFVGRRLEGKLKQSGAVPGRRTIKKNEGDETVKKNEGDEKNRKLRDTHLLVATLIATVSFAAGFTIPGGYQSDKGPNQGFAILSRNAAFQAFIVTNTIAMTFSSCAVLLNLYSSIYGKRSVLSTTLVIVSQITMLALVAMVIAFITGTYAVLGHSSSLGITVCVLGILLFFGLYEVIINDETSLTMAIPLVPLTILLVLIGGLMFKMFLAMGKLLHLCVGSNSSAPKGEGRWSKSTLPTSISSQLCSEREMDVYNRC